MWELIGNYAQKIHFSYLLLLSAPIILVFGFFRKWQYRVAWYVAISAPGTLLSPFYLFGFFFPAIHRWLSGGPFSQDYVYWPIFGLTLFPATWVLPTVLGVQLVKLFRREWRPTNNASDWAVAGLVLLYLEFEFVSDVLR